MDPRGIGIWDGGPNELAIWALDNNEAGVEGRVSFRYQVIPLFAPLLGISFVTHALCQ